MQLDLGQTILLKHTRERARVIAALEGGQWMVEAEMDKERFPVHEDDIDPAVGSKKPQTQVTADVTPGEIRLRAGTTSAEIQLAFIPVGELDFTACLLNHSQHTVVYAAHLLTNRGQQWAKHGLLPPVQGLQLGHLYRDLLNENAAIEVQVSRKAAQGTDSKQATLIKLKPKLFHKNTQVVNWFPEELSVFDVFTKVHLVRTPKPQAAPPPSPQREEVQPKPPRRVLRVRDYGVKAAAEFPTELDLHIDKLVKDASALSGEEMLELQLQHMRKYLDVAIRLGIDRVFLIHGKGKGTLRTRIAQELNKMGDLEGFKQEFHPKYGQGATEVILR